MHMDTGIKLFRVPVQEQAQEVQEKGKEGMRERGKKGKGEHTPPAMQGELHRAVKA